MDTSLSIDAKSAAAVTELFQRATQANLNCSLRHGSIDDLPDHGQLLVTGDLHDHRENFDKALKLAKLDADEHHHLILQELIHGEHLINNMDFSYRTLARAAELKVRMPEQVHCLLANHELAQVRDEGIVKDSVSVVEAFDAGLDYIFGEDAAGVRDAIRAFVESMPLAVRCANGILCSHSLPPPRKLASFDPGVLERVPTEDDYRNPGGSAHLLVWGRNLTQSMADQLAERWGVKLFVLGHQHADMGYEECGDTMLIINSDHAHGVALPIDLAHTYTRDELAEAALPLAAVL